MVFTKMSKTDFQRTDFTVCGGDSAFNTFIVPWQPVKNKPTIAEGKLATLFPGGAEHQNVNEEDVLQAEDVFVLVQW